MKILLTGAFGNLGSHTLEILLSQNHHEILAFDMGTRKNEKTRQTLVRVGSFETHRGDISDSKAACHVVKDRECILHLAGIIPPLSEQAPDLVQRVNVGGTHNLIVAAQQLEKKPKFVFTSSIAVHGVQHANPPPRRAHDPLEPIDHYSRSKVDSETELKASGLPWSILRIGAAMPLDLLDRDMKSSSAALFAIPLDQRIEAVHPRDVATAVANSVSADTTGKILYLGGGASCQMSHREFTQRMFDVLGISMPPESAFRVAKHDKDYWYTDFMDTEESQRLLNFQNHTFEDYLEEVRKRFGWKRLFTKPLSPLIHRFMVRYSPYGEDQRG